jgi:UDPglucose 6-dehydrogenase
MTNTIAYVGMTHLGLCSAVGAAARGARVLCYDPSADRITELARGELGIDEPGLREALAAHAERIQLSSDPATLAACALAYVAPDVPTTESGKSDLSLVSHLLAHTCKHVPESTPVVLLSQVHPGYTRAHRRAAGPLYYQVETLIFGRALERAMYPERTIVGSADPEAPLPRLYAEHLARFGDVPVLAMRHESAELCKIAINLCLASSLSTANALAELCAGIGADWGEIVPALRLDARIGPHAYLAPGLGIGGGNIGRDLATVRSLSTGVGADTAVVGAFVADSEYRRDWALRTLHREVPLSHRTRVAVLGIAYKQDTASTVNSPGIRLIRSLGSCEVAVYDPVVPESHPLPPRARRAESALDACAGAAAVAIMTPWAELRELKPTDMARAMAGRCVIDPFRVLDAAECRTAGLDHLTLGAPPARAQAFASTTREESPACSST